MWQRALISSAATLLAASVIAQEASQSANEPVRVSERAARNKNAPDIDAFLKLSLPPNPTKHEAIDYVNVIAALSANQHTNLAGDPQVTMLAKVGRPHLDVLLAAANGTISTYALRAIAMLVTEEDKDWVLQHLPGKPGLSKVLLAKSWCNDAADTLVRIILASRGYIADEVFDCLAYMPANLYEPAIKTLLARRDTSTHLLRQVQHLPGIDIDAELIEAWEHAYYNKDRYELGYWTYETLRIGHLRAFHFLFEVLEESLDLPITIFEAESMIRQVSHLHCSKSELAAWYRLNRDQIRFDRKSGHYTATTRQRPFADRCPRQ